MLSIKKYSTARIACTIVAFFSLVLTSCASTQNNSTRHSSSVTGSSPVLPATSNSSILTYGIIPPQLPIVLPSVPVPKIQMPKVIEALKELSGGHPFIVHIYTTWSQYPSSLQSLTTEIEDYASAGFIISLTLRYLPPSGKNGDIAGFQRYVQSMIEHFANQPAIKFLQITNEPNSSANPAASDGAYTNVVSALVTGVEAAYAEEKKVHFNAKIGFNWFYSFGRSQDVKFWREVGATGGSRFAHDVSWVGVDLYPGTYVPFTLPPETAKDFASTASTDVESALNYVRTQLMPLAGLGKSVPMGISEIGWATNPPSRSFSEQSALVTAFSYGACSVVRQDNLEFMQWFDLADNAVSLPQSPLKMGIMRYNFSPKPAFYAYKKVIAQGCS